MCTCVYTHAPSHKGINTHRPHTYPKKEKKDDEEIKVFSSGDVGMALSLTGIKQKAPAWQLTKSWGRGDTSGTKARVLMILGGQGGGGGRD